MTIDGRGTDEALGLPIAIPVALRHGLCKSELEETANVLDAGLLCHRLYLMSCSRKGSGVVKV